MKSLKTIFIVFIECFLLSSFNLTFENFAFYNIPATKQAVFIMLINTFVALSMVRLIMQFRAVT